MFSAQRPPEIWAITVICFAAVIGCTNGTCEVANIHGYFVAAARPAAKVKVSKPGQAKFVTPPNPRQRATGTIASNSI